MTENISPLNTLQRETLLEAIARIKIHFWDKFAYYCLPYRRKIVEANIALALGKDLSLAQQKQLSQAFYGHLLKSLVENLSLPFLSKKKIAKKARIMSHEKALAQIESGKGFIILTGHFGNWELGPIAGILNFTAYQGRIHFIRRMQSLEWLGRLFFRRYEKFGLSVITQANALEKACDCLEKEEAVVFVVDQNPPLGSKDGILVPFFGSKTPTYRSIAMIAKHMNVPVIPASTYRDEQGIHVLEFFDPMVWQSDPDHKKELYLNTRAYNEAIENMVVKHPEQWLWLYKRWKKPK